MQVFFEEAFCAVSHFVFIKQLLSNIRLIPGAKQPKTICYQKHHISHEENIL